MTLQALGYVGFGSSALDDWRQFGTGLVGLQAVERSSSLLAFRMDDRKQRIVIDRALPEGERFFGWEVADAAAAKSSRKPGRRSKCTTVRACGAMSAAGCRPPTARCRARCG